METAEERKEHKKRMKQNQRLRKEAKLQEIFQLIADSAPDLSAGLVDSEDEEDCLDKVIADFFKPIQNR